MGSTSSYGHSLKNNCCKVLNRVRTVLRIGNFCQDSNRVRAIPVGMIKDCWFAFNIEWVGHSFRYILRKYRTLRNRLFKMLARISPVGQSTDQPAPKRGLESFHVNSDVSALQPPCPRHWVCLYECLFLSFCFCYLFLHFSKNYWKIWFSGILTIR